MDDGILTPDDKEKIKQDMKETLNDMSGVGKKLLAPFFDWIEQNYDKLSKEKKQIVCDTINGLKQAKDNSIFGIKQAYNKLLKIIRKN